MKMYRIILIGICAVLIATGLFAGPTIIRDSRVSDTAITPVLGRGYSIGTNTFQSTCMEDVIITEPSYDFTYSFESMDETVTTKTTTNQTGTREVSTESGTSTSQPEYSGQYKYGSWTYSWSKEYRNVYKKMISKVGKFKESGEKKLYTHIVNVNIDLHSYYASVDESKSKMSESAANLLTNNDLAGFFSSCGPYYVRSIGRHAVFQSFFEYQTEDSKRDESFEGMLEEQIKGFRVAVYTYSGGYGGRTYTGEYQGRREEYTQPVKQEPLAEKFNEEASKKHLTITTMAYGLGKNKDATLISYDIDTFKAAIKDAFLSMQDTNTGKVEQMEVVPWVENVAFQNVLNIQDEDEEAAVLDSAGNPVLDKDGKPQKRKLMLYEKKLLLNENAEFIIEIDRVDRNIMNMYYKAKLCRRNIDMNWKIREGNKFTEIKPEYKDVRIQNKKDITKTLPLSELDNIVSEARVNEILAQHREFMYGGEGGASACMREIMKQGIYKISYRDIEACKPVIANMGEIQNDTIEHY